MRHTEAGLGEPEEELKEKDTRLELVGRTIKQLEGQSGTGDNGGSERQKHC